MGVEEGDVRESILSGARVGSREEIRAGIDSALQRKVPPAERAVFLILARYSGKGEGTSSPLC